MNPKRAQSLQAGLTSVSAKVYNCVPIETEWTAAQIQSELFRQGVNRDRRVVEGCLANLLADSLIREPHPGVFTRTIVREKGKLSIVAPVEEFADTTPVTIKEEEMRTPIDILTDLTVMARNLVQAIEAAAIEIEEQFNSNSEETKKLKQLQQLLKSLG
jgi:hypothetical protein